MDTLTPLLCLLARGDLPAARRAAATHHRALVDAGRRQEAQDFARGLEQALAEIPAHPAYLGRYPHGRSSARVFSARGLTALALAGPGAAMTLRVPHDPDGQGRAFTDYRWHHDDASVRIDDDLAALYVRDDGVCIFDHAPQVLGLERQPAQPRDPPLPEPDPAG